MTTLLENTYVINYTDSSEGTIAIPKGALITDELDIILLGKRKENYGQIFNENAIHILENFACQEDPNSPGTPNLALTYSTLLQNPTFGQFWYNTTQKRMFFYNTAGEWKSLAKGDDVAGNWGVIAHGATLPVPTGYFGGYNFDITECSWIVTPFALPDNVDSVRCYTDENGVVTAQYRLYGETAYTNGYANYSIIGIKNNSNEGEL
jgi:hypothetical protein